MGYMFYVRSSPYPAPNLQSSPPLRLACTAVASALPPPRPQLAPHRVCPPFDSRQNARAFNQPLSFDTSSVTNIGYMFYVRSSPCPAPNLQSRPPLHAACTGIARRPPASTRVATRPAHPMPSVRLSAERGGVQPAAEL
eukprot:scaffold51305_cov60-Phaeocystis_antarctica.AAC.1